MSETRKLSQCTKCGALVHQDEAPTIQFYAEHNPLPYCQKCFDAIPYVYKRQLGDRMTQGNWLV